MGRKSGRRWGRGEVGRRSGSKGVRGRGEVGRRSGVRWGRGGVRWEEGVLVVE